MKQTNNPGHPRNQERFFFRYALPMGDGSVREGALVYLERGGWGEAAPLPGWSKETLEEVRHFLRSGKGQEPASVRCAMEAADAAGWPLHQARVPVNALLRGSEQEMLAQAHRALEGGCECLKIKTEKISLGRLPAFLRAVLRGAPTRCRLRLDPNRSWGFQETLSVAESLADLPISYIEEPLREVGRLPELIAKCPLPIALDETLRSISPQDMEPYRGAAALVLKPTLLGGFTACRAFAEAGLALGMLPVVSACYESGVGIDALGRFAASLPVVAPAGLDTYSSLVSDVLCERLDLRDFVFRADTPRPNVDRSRLLPL